MNPELQSRWQQLEESKQAMVSMLGNRLRDEHFQPTGEWSMAQVVEHILASEGGTLGYMKKKSSGGWDSLEEATSEHHEKSSAINARLESDERYKAPDVLPEPGNTTPLNELLHTWNLLREQLYNFLLTIESAHHNKLVFRQPAAGMLTVLHTLEFMDAHLRHHLPQIERINQG